MNKKNYNPGKLWPIVKIAIGMVRDNPRLIDEPDNLKAMLKANIPELKNPERCANCGASMLEYVFEFDCLDALMLLEMAREVRERLNLYDFTNANQIRVQSLLGATYAMKSRTTQMSKLGLIAKLTGSNGKHVPGTWVITKRGWLALRGKEVPKSVKVWHGQIFERTEETTTLGRAFKLHREKVEQLIKKKKTVRTDYRDLFSDYRPEEWYRFGDMHEGKLI